MSMDGVRRRAVLAAVVLVLASLAVGLGVQHHAGPTRAARPALDFRPASSPPQGVTRDGTRLLLDGLPWRFTGVNDYGAATDYGVNWGCGAPTTDLDTMFASLRPHSVVRFWAFQAQAWNNKAVPQHLDFTGIDRVVRAAERHHQLLILTLSDQSGTCDDGTWHDPRWYDGGFRTRRDDDGRGLSDRSYLDYVRTVVYRYRDSPAVAFWEPVNEAEASTCTGATGHACFDSSKRSCPHDAVLSLRGFFDAIGPVIRQLDPRHLISAGVSGGYVCGLAAGDSRIVADSPYVDLMTFHDYSDPADARSGGLEERVQQATEEGKPIAVEEAGITAGQGCLSPGARAAAFDVKLRHAFTVGAVGYVPWWYSESPSACGQDFGPDDPLLTVLRRAPA